MGKDEQIAAALDVYWADINQGGSRTTDELDSEVIQIVQRLHRTLQPPKPSPAFLSELRQILITEAEGVVQSLQTEHRPRRLRRLARTMAAAAMFLAGLLTITPTREAAVYATNGIIKVIHNAEAGLTDRQREAIHHTAHERDNAYLRAFVAQHRDPHSLPPVWIQTYAPPPPTLAAAAAGAQMIVYGQVESVTFAVNSSGGMPTAISQIRVQQTIKGSRSQALTVAQLGGPVAHGPDGALAEMVNNELALPGDDVVLLLRRASALQPWHTVTGGVYFVRHGVVMSQSGDYYHLSGETVEGFIDRLSAAAGR